MSQSLIFEPDWLITQYILLVKPQFHSYIQQGVSTTRSMLVTIMSYVICLHKSNNLCSRNNILQYPLMCKTKPWLYKSNIKQNSNATAIMSCGKREEYKQSKVQKMHGDDMKLNLLSEKQKAHTCENRFATWDH